MVQGRSRAPGKTLEKKGEQGVLAPFEHQAKKIQRLLFSIKEVEVDGIAMGILSDGTPYLHLHGLARMCGIHHAPLLRLANNWEEEQLKPRGVKIKEILAAQGHSGAELNTQAAAGVDTHVYTDAVCMAVLEYYAFEATQGDNTVALKNYRLLARSSFRRFIFDQCGYDPDRHIPQSWRNFHERVLLNDQLPVGYFSIFREIADIVVHMIKAGCPLDSHTVPDISVGITWGNHWKDCDYNQKYGERIKYEHTYPDWFPQSSANPVPAWIYPTNALGAFHNWVHRHYLTQKFPKYVESKVKSGAFLPGRAQELIAAVARKELPSSRE